MTPENLQIFGGLSPAFRPHSTKAEVFKILLKAYLFRNLNGCFALLALTEGGTSVRSVYIVA